MDFRYLARNYVGNESAKGRILVPEPIYRKAVKQTRINDNDKLIINKIQNSA
jgi:hypothetical protein